MQENQGTIDPSEIFHNTSGRAIKDTIPKVDSTFWSKGCPAAAAKRSPSEAELKSWQDAKIFGIWVDGKRINNTELNKYKPDDYGWFNVSKLYKNAVNYGKHYYEVCLYTKKYYEEKIIVTNTSPRIFVKEVLLSDTTKPAQDQPLIVINDKPMDGLSISDLDKILSPNDIESITVVKGQNAIDKYGDKAKNGAIVIKAKKLTPNNKCKYRKNNCR